jgi:hypothetical protein
VWGSRPVDHPWTRAAAQAGPTCRGSGGAVIRHLRVSWLEPEESVA